MFTTLHSLFSLLSATWVGLSLCTLSPVANGSPVSPGDTPTQNTSPKARYLQPKPQRAPLKPVTHSMTLGELGAFSFNTVYKAFGKFVAKPLGELGLEFETPSQVHIINRHIYHTETVDDSHHLFAPSLTLGDIAKLMSQTFLQGQILLPGQMVNTYLCHNYNDKSYKCHHYVENEQAYILITQTKDTGRGLVPHFVTFFPLEIIRLSPEEEATTTVEQLKDMAQNQGAKILQTLFYKECAYQPLIG